MPEKTTSKGSSADKDLLNLLAFTAAVILLLFYSKALQNRKYWIYMECALGVLYAVMFMFTGVMTSYFMNTTEPMILYLERLNIVVLMSQALSVYFSKDSFDRTVPIAVSISNLLSRGAAALMLLGYSYMGKSLGMKKSDMYLNIVFALLLVIGDLYHVTTSKTKTYSHRTVGDPISFHLSIDAIATFFLGSFILGFPDMFFAFAVPKFGTPSELHLFCTKSFGLLLLGGSILSFASLCYRYEDDAISTLKSKAAIYATVVILALTNMIISSTFRSLGHTALIGTMGALAFNAVLMIYSHEKED